jgi:hypothetical protein
MSKSPPFNLLYHLFGPVWMASNRYKGMQYDAGNRDLHEAKLFIQLHPDIFDDDGMISFQEHAIEYLKSNHEAWVNQNHPCWGLLRNYGTFVPKKVVETVKRKRMIECMSCGTSHGMNDPCPQVEK